MLKSSMKVRCSSRDFLRLHLTIGIIALVIAGLLFAVIAAHVVSGDALTIVDVQLAQWLHERSRPLLTQGLLIISHVHDPIIISVIAALMMLTLAWKKHWYAAVAVLLGVQGGMLLNLLVKQVFHRARPSFENPLVTLTTYSFPSGHVVASTVFYGVLTVLLISQTPSRRRAYCIALAALAMVMLVAFSRMYLGAHYLTDVMAGFLEAVAWLALCLTAIQIYLDYRATDKLP